MDQTIREFFEQNKNKKGNKLKKSLEYYFDIKEYKTMVESFPKLYSTHLCQDEDGKLYLNCVWGGFGKTRNAPIPYCLVENATLYYLYLLVVERTKIEYENLRNLATALREYELNNQ